MSYRFIAILSFLLVVVIGFGAIILTITYSNSAESLPTTDRFIVQSRNQVNVIPSNMTYFLIIKDKETNKEYLLIVHGGRPAIIPLEEK